MREERRMTITELKERKEAGRFKNKYMFTFLKSIS